jgi:RNA polymerase sigma-70 factor (ECF subfamily)
MLRQPEIAEDIVQETFVRIWQTAKSFDPTKGKAEAWIITIARNLIISYIRKNSNAVPLINETEEATLIADSAPGPEESLWLNMRHSIIQDALSQLPEAQRIMVKLAYFDGMTHAQIAVRTGEPLGTVKSRLRLALRRLQELLAENLSDEPSTPNVYANPRQRQGGETE